MYCKPVDVEIRAPLSNYFRLILIPQQNVSFQLIASSLKRRFIAVFKDQSTDPIYRWPYMECPFLSFGCFSPYSRWIVDCDSNFFLFLLFSFVEITNHMLSLNTNYSRNIDDENMFAVGLSHRTHYNRKHWFKSNDTGADVAAAIKFHFETLSAVVFFFLFSNYTCTVYR